MLEACAIAINLGGIALLKVMWLSESIRNQGYIRFWIT